MNTVTQKEMSKPESLDTAKYLLDRIQFFAMTGLIPFQIEWLYASEEELYDVIQEIWALGVMPLEVVMEGDLIGANKKYIQPYFLRKICCKTE